MCLNRPTRGEYHGRSVGRRHQLGSHYCPSVIEDAATHAEWLISRCDSRRMADFAKLLCSEDRPGQCRLWAVREDGPCL